jgi:hypothetical protein
MTTTGRVLAIGVMAIGALGLAGCDDDEVGGVDAPARLDSGPGVPAQDAAVIDVPAQDVAVIDGPASESGGDRVGDPPAATDGDAADGPAEAGVAAPTMLDLILVIDNSNTMQEEQTNLRANLPRLIAVLQALPGGLPDLRIAILSSNFGAGNSHSAPECDSYGDRARFQVRPECGLMPGARWLAASAAGQTNFQGDLQSVFGCLANLGTGGCGYEHHLQSLRATFSTAVHPEGAGFLRDEAHLGIIILADEDDCSGEPDADFFRDPIPGQAGSLRCALRGHVCMDQPVSATAGFTAPLSSCRPAAHLNTPEDRRQKLINVSTFVNDIKALKSGREQRILVSVIVGWDPSPGASYRIVSRMGVAGPEVDLAPICSNQGTGSAAPAVRLVNFARSFARHTVHSICAEDLGPTLTEIGQRLAGMTGP